MHDDDGLVDKHPLVIRHYENPVSVRDMLHGTLDRLLDTLIASHETMGAASVTVLSAEGITEEIFGGKTMMIALDLDPQPGECDCGYCGGPEEE